MTKTGYTTKKSFMERKGKKVFKGLEPYFESVWTYYIDKSGKEKLLFSEVYPDKTAYYRTATKINPDLKKM